MAYYTIAKDQNNPKRRVITCITQDWAEAQEVKGYCEPGDAYAVSDLEAMRIFGSGTLRRMVMGYRSQK